MSLTRAGVLGAVAAILIACGTSNVPNDAQVSISGTLLTAEGTPASGVTIGLMEEPDGLSALVELTATITTVGMLCLTQTVAICKGARKTTTDDQGRYSFTMSGKDSKNILGNPARFALSSELPSGARVQTRFELSATSIAVPATTFWEPKKLSATPGPQWITYSFSDFKIKRLRGYQISLTRNEETLWIQAGPPSGKVDARVAADADSDFHAIATVEQKEADITFTTTHHSPRIGIKGVAGQPLSRGLKCSVAGAGKELDPCPLTDDRFSGSFPSQTCPTQSPAPSKCTANSWVTLDLGVTRPLSAFFLHGLGMSTDPIVETSDDGLRWTRRAKQKPAEFLAVTLPAGVSARYVRLRSTNDTDTIYALTELSIW